MAPASLKFLRYKSIWVQQNSYTDTHLMSGRHTGSLPQGSRSLLCTSAEHEVAHSPNAIKRPTRKSHSYHCRCFNQ